MAVAKKRTVGRRRGQRKWQLAELERRIMLAGDVALIATPAGTESAPAAEIGSAVVAESTVNLVFVSSDDPQTVSLVDGMEEGHEYVLLDPNRGGLNQITEHLRTRQGVASVHIVAHGNAGRIVVGNQTVTTETLNESQAELRSWAKSLTADADILLYGCEVASDGFGQSFVRRLAQLTGADVAASTDLTGDESLGGDWDLEFTIGSVEAGLAIHETGRGRFEGVLPITIRAAGVTNEEQMVVQVDGDTVATFDNVGGSAYGGIFETYNVDVDGASAEDVRIVFTNDLIDPVTGADRNLRVDHIDIDGVVYETEDPTVFSTGTWLPEDGIVPGFRESEFLHADGYFQFAELEPNDGSVIQIRANGTEGPESMELRIDGDIVQTWSALGTTPQTFSYVAADEVTASQIRVGFTNDLWDPVAGIDRNLVVDWIEIDGERQETEDPAVFSTGSWLPSDGIVPGFRQSEVLNAAGYFQYADEDQSPNDGSLIVVYANGAEGDENVSLLIDETSVASWSSIGTSQQSFAYTAADVVTADQIRVAFSNDLWDPATNTDRNLVVDRITLDGVNYETEHPSVYSTGSWLPADGIVPGFRQSEVLNANGYFQYASQLTPQPGTIAVASTVIAVDESAVSVALTVNRTGGSDGEVSVSFATTDGSPTQTEDYVAASDTLTFLDGETVKTIVVTLLPDLVDEPDEDFSITLSDATGGATILDPTTVVTIVDNDGPAAPGTPA